MVHSVSAPAARIAASVARCPAASAFGTAASDEHMCPGSTGGSSTSSSPGTAAKISATSRFTATRP